MFRLNLKKVSSLIVGLFLLSLSGSGQNNIITNQFWLQMPLYNPAASGVFNDLEFATGIQYQDPKNIFGGNDFDLSNPEMFVRGDIFIDKANSGFGLNYHNNNVNRLFSEDGDYYLYQRIAINYNYQYRFSQKNTLVIGVNLDVENVSWRRIWISPDPGPDPTLPPETSNNSGYNLGLGIIYKSKLWYAGLSKMPTWRISEPSYFFTRKNDNNFIFTGGGKIPLGNSFFMNADLFLASDEESKFYSNIAMRFTYKNLVYLGFGLASSFNSADSWQAIAGVNLKKKYTLHYGYGQAISDLSVNSGSIHNIAFQFVLPSSQSKK